MKCISLDFETSYNHGIFTRVFFFFKNICMVQIYKFQDAYFSFEIQITVSKSRFQFQKADFSFRWQILVSRFRFDFQEADLIFAMKFKG